MRQRPDFRELAHTLVPVLAALLVLATAPWWEPYTGEGAAAGLGPWMALVLISATAALYRPSPRQTLALGTLSLPPLIWSFGLGRAGWAAAAAYLLATVGRRFLFAVPWRRMESVGALPSLTDASRVALATVGAGWVWRRGLPPDPEEGSALEVVLWTLLAAGIYVALLLILQWLELRDFGVAGERVPRESLRSSGLDLAGWILGVSIVGVVVATGWFEALALSTGIALLAAEAARNVFLRHRALQRAAELWEVTKAGHRIIFRGPDLASMAGHVLEECRQVIPFHWFQFELLAGEERGRSWRAGPDGLLQEGIPEPADSPPALPGVHRRTSWKILQRQLKGDGEPIAVMRFWCDPRKLENTSVELLDSLLPQIAAAIHRALLDRRAKQDPLTGLADRRVLEARLEEVFTRSRSEGVSMAVIMCDLDRFKRINDQHGHDVGDRALKKVVESLEEHRRETDVCCRYGGEEFALVLEHTDGATALQIAERLRLAVEQTTFAPHGNTIPLRLSAGVAAFPELQVKEGKDLLVLADAALIEAKRRGRNRSLLNLGRQRYGTAGGQTLEEGSEPSEPRAPTLFA